MPEWQQIGTVEVCVGTDGVTGISGGGFVQARGAGGVTVGLMFDDDVRSAKAKFEADYCQPRHRLIECADGAVMVLSVDEVGGKPRRGAIVRQDWATGHFAVVSDPFYTTYPSKDQAIAAAVAYVTVR